MKFQLTIALALAIIATPAFAGNWMPKSKILAESKQAFELEDTCKRVSGEECFDVGSNPSKIYSEIYLKAGTESCADEADCQAKLEAKSCDANWSAIKNLDLLEVYCTKATMAVDEAKEDAYQAEQAAAAVAASQAAGIAAVNKIGKCAEGVIDLMVLRNSQKSPALTTAQVKQFVSTFAPIQNLLLARSLVSAKEEVQAIEPDGVLVTASDKAAVIAAIDVCLGN